MREHLIQHRGRANVSERTWAALEEAERLAGFRFVITQGGYNKGAVDASAGTHDGGGVVDIRARDLSATRRATVVRCLRRVGFAAWLRIRSQGFDVDHIHAVLKGDKDLSRSAAAQVKSFEAGRSGLSSNRPDPTATPYRGVTWEKYLAARPKPLTPAKPSGSASPKEDDDMANAASVEKKIDALAAVLGLRYKADADRYEAEADWNTADVARDNAEMGVLTRIEGKLNDLLNQKGA